MLYPLIGTKPYDGKLYQSPGATIDLLITLGAALVIDCTFESLIPGNMPRVFVKIPFQDAPFPSGKEGFILYTRLHNVARMAAWFLRDGERVLTYCGPGENRSSLVNGLILIAYRTMGLVNFSSVVEFIRDRRPGALKNQCHETQSI